MPDSVQEKLYCTIDVAVGAYDNKTLGRRADGVALCKSHPGWQKTPVCRFQFQYGRTIGWTVIGADAYLAESDKNRNSH
jgi:hypothetical protein